MPEKIKLYDTGDCVNVTHWNGCTGDGLLHSQESIGLVLEAELVEMDLNRGGKFIPTQEWMYRVTLSDGVIVEAWDYEIRPVNVMGKEYNNNIATQMEKRDGSKQEE